MGESIRSALGLAAAEVRQGCLGLALEAAFLDEGRFAVPDEDDRCIEATRHEGI
jgi:hypothetical protein